MVVLVAAHLFKKCIHGATLDDTQAMHLLNQEFKVCMFYVSACILVLDFAFVNVEGFHTKKG